VQTNPGKGWKPDFYESAMGERYTEDNKKARSKMGQMINKMRSKRRNPPGNAFKIVGYLLSSLGICVALARACKVAFS